MVIPNGPRIFPFFLWLRWKERVLQFLERCVSDYGSDFTFRQFNSPPYVILSDPCSIKDIFAAPADVFCSGVTNQPFKPLLGKNSLLLLDGDHHRQQRKLVMSSMHKEQIKQYGTLICDITQRHLAHWPTDRPISIESAVQNIVIEVAAFVTLGIEQAEKSAYLRQLLKRLSKSFVSPVLRPFAFPRDRKELNCLIYEQIEQQSCATTSTCVLGHLLNARDNTGKSLTAEEIRDQIVTLVLAGYETTTAAITWTLYWIAKHSQVRENLLRELQQHDIASCPDQVVQLPYLMAICNESLRMYSITGFAFDRIVRQPVSVNDWDFSPGTQLSLCPYLTHQREDIYSSPKSFKPERFLNRRYAPYEFYPFGGSNRRCVGEIFALYQMKLVVATVVSRYVLSLTQVNSVRPIIRSITVSVPPNLKIVASSL